MSYAEDMNATATYPMVGSYDNILDSPGDSWRGISTAHIKQEAMDVHDDSGISPGHEGPSPDRGGAGAGVFSAEDYYRPEGVGEPAPPPPPNDDGPGGPGNGGGGDDRSSSSSGSDGDGEDALRRLQVALETSEALRPGGGAGGTTFQCPLCTFRTLERAQFDAHLGAHCEHKCPACDHVAPSNDALRAHMRETHALSPPQDDPAETRVNSQGRVKTFRCKQCGFVAITKLGFWEHSRCHIRAEKLLTCPRCPFVTEYKHHLEYHLRNHTGSKPFRCDKCPYSCVNKSMLNSHLKSHSNVYQYRCADCSYATKYCHSLKLHLRKYAHRPDTVLNPDGSPNPLPIIDVYGTRRGPKQRPRTAPPTSEDVKPPSPPSQFPQSPFTLLARPGGLPFPYNTMPFPPTTTPMAPAFPYSVAPREGSDAVTPFFNNNNNEHVLQEESEGFKDYISRILSTTQLLIPKVPMPTPPPTAAPAASPPLDLSKPEPSGDVPSATVPSPPKNRRKGKAFKLERIAMKLQYQQQSQQLGAKEGDAMEEADEESGDDAPSEDFNCTFCDITFRDMVLYQLHKGYHGHKDPFTCNSCGQQTTGKVDFFMHIARSPHS